MRGSSTQVLEIIEAIYRSEKSERAWLEGILVAARPAIDRGSGVVIFPFEATLSEVRMSWAKILGAPAGVGRAFIQSVMATARDDEQVSEAYRLVPCTTGSEQRLTGKRGFDLLRTKGIRDALAINAFDTAGHGIYLGALLPRVTQLDPASRARFARVAAHLGVGLRYRLLAKNVGRAADAVFDPGAKLLHAEGDATKARARDALTRAVAAIERARGRQRRSDPDGALGAWKGLVAARWSLVDEFESDGKRYVVARENEPRVPPLATLTKRERQIVGYVALGHENKLIAYELGIADSTVRVLLRRAMQKLRVKARSQLAALFFAASAAKAPTDG